MDSTPFNDLLPEEQEWLDAYLDGTIDADAFEALQDRLLENASLRVVMRRYLALDGSLQLEIDQASTTSASATAPWLKLVDDPEGTAVSKKKGIHLPFPVSIAAAAAVAFVLGTAVMHFMGRSDRAPDDALSRAASEEPSAHGFAVVGNLFDVVWADADSSHQEGDILGAESIRLTSGTAKIQFFSGANMTLEGPAEITLKSAWEATCRDGAVRMQVPPAARGFKLQAPSTEIIDLGTEFGLVVRNGEGHVEVFDGEIAIRHRQEAERRVTKGLALGLTSDGPAEPAEVGKIAFPNAERFGARADQEHLADFEQWTAHRDALATDERLLSYYTFDRENASALIPNLTAPRNPEFDGAVILAEAVDGRWPGLNSALEFNRPGARVRVNLPGEFSALTFVCWVRIDSLDRWYNALFMADGYETGEPHWQIRDDGKMMLSVMIDDTRQHPKFPKSRYHRVYFSPPIWDPSKSGQWVHLASVFDPENRAVSHYLNGERISRGEIEPVDQIDTFRIGNGEIGNWSQPLREDPTFAMRNLNGRMDEFAIFRTVLDDEEIAQLHERSRAGRH